MQARAESAPRLLEKRPATQPVLLSKQPLSLWPLPHGFLQTKSRAGRPYHTSAEDAAQVVEKVPAAQLMQTSDEEASGSQPSV